MVFAKLFDFQEPVPGQLLAHVRISGDEEEADAPYQIVLTTMSRSAVTMRLAYSFHTEELRDEEFVAFDAHQAAHQYAEMQATLSGATPALDQAALALTTQAVA